MSIASRYSTPPGLADLPTEILIETLSGLPWTRTVLGDLKLVCRRFNDVLTNYEHSIACDLIKTCLPPTSRCRFPGLFQSRVIKYTTVDILQRRWQAIERIEKSCHTIRERDGKHAEWIISKWISLQGIGLCLLFRLNDCSKESIAPSLQCSNISSQFRRAGRINQVSAFHITSGTTFYPSNVDTPTPRRWPRHHTPPQSCASRSF